MTREDILQRLHREGEELEIPASISPDEIEGRLKMTGQREAQRGGRGIRRVWRYPAAACLLLVAAVLAGGLYPAFSNGPALSQTESGLSSGLACSAAEGTKEIPLPQERDNIEIPSVTYEEIYAKLSDTWQQEMLFRDAQKQYAGNAVAEASADTSGPSAVQELSDSAAVKAEAYGKTNIQVDEVDEADCVKNDGRYLYQVIQRETGDDGTGEEAQGIQILDTEGGLRETAFVEGFENLQEFYVWEDYLITIENKYEEGVGYEYAGPRAVEDLCYKWGSVVSWHEITIYDIADRETPHKKKTFSFKGSYETSRIADGYLYGISSFHAQPGEGEEDYSAYIPTVDDKTIPADKIYCPADVEGSDYLVFVSIDLSKPDSVADSRAILFGSGIYYMSRKNIYVTDYEPVYGSEPEHEGTVTDRTKILRFSFVRGKFYAQAEGEIPGRLNDNFSLDEHSGCLRAVTTVQTCSAKKVKDDRTGEFIGYDFQELRQTNALYVLGSRLSPRGKIEGLAEGEEIYSARFLGDTGYFVTFRQVDPLFAVDLSNPEEPKVIGELKVSGFSEYLHFYGEDLLLGIGMEADEESGRTEGMKLSMFDLSDPAQLKEVSKLNLKDYNYSEALWDYHAVLIDTEENLIGFPAEGSGRGKYWMDYMVFSYEDGDFVQKFRYRCSEDDGRYYRMRGTFIGDTFYLLKENGNVRAYDRESGEMLEEVG